MALIASRPFSGDFRAITPHDSTNLAYMTRAIYVGGAGDVTAVDENDNAVLFKAPPVGTQLNIRCKRVNATGTTATLLVALF